MRPSIIRKRNKIMTYHFVTIIRRIIRRKCAIPSLQCHGYNDAGILFLFAIAIGYEFTIM